MKKQGRIYKTFVFADRDNNISALVEREVVHLTQIEEKVEVLHQEFPDGRVVLAQIKGNNIVQFHYQRSPSNDLFAISYNGEVTNVNFISLTTLEDLLILNLPDS